MEFVASKPSVGESPPAASSQEAPSGSSSFHETHEGFQAFMSTVEAETHGTNAETLNKEVSNEPTGSSFKASRACIKSVYVI